MENVCSIVCQSVQEECALLWKELELRDSLIVQSLNNREGVEVIAGSQNKDGEPDWKRAIKLSVGSSYPSEAPTISFSVLPSQKAVDYARHIFLKKVQDSNRTTVGEILRLWFEDICTRYFQETRG